MNQNEYLQQRVDDQINWMEGKSKYNQVQYKRLKVMELISAAAIPLLVSYHDYGKIFQVITGMLGVLIIVLNGIQQLYKYHENWLTYRTTLEALKREKLDRKSVV